MSDTPSTPENPYAAPQVVSAELVPAVDPTELGPGELPCHRCGQAVLPSADTCPRCGVGPRFDGLQLIVTAVFSCLVFGGGLIALQFLFQGFDPGPPAILGLIPAVAVVSPMVHRLFKKLRGGLW